MWESVAIDGGEAARDKNFNWTHVVHSEYTVTENQVKMVPRVRGSHPMLNSRFRVPLSVSSGENKTRKQVIEMKSYAIMSRILVSDT